MVHAGALSPDTCTRGGGATQRLSVLFVSHTASIWGAERALLRLAPLLLERGVEPRLASPPRGPFPTAWNQLGLDHVALTLPDHTGIRDSHNGSGRTGPAHLAAEGRVVARSAATIARLARGADIIHSNSLWGHVEVAMAGRWSRRPAVLELHDLVAPGMGRWLLSGAVAISASTIAVSKAVAACAGAFGGSRVTVLPHGLDLDRFRPGRPDPSVRAALGVPPDVPLVGILGRLDAEKGIEMVVQAMGLLRGESALAHLVVMGAPHRQSEAYAAQLETDARRALGHRISFCPPTDDVPDVLRALDVLVNASWAEPFGLTVLEAQACGTPVVASAAGGPLELIRDGDTGLLFPPGDPGALAHALQRLLTDSELATRIAHAARAQVERHHDLDGRADAVVELYQRVARR